MLSDSLGKSNVVRIRWQQLCAMKGVVSCFSMRSFCVWSLTNWRCHQHLKLNHINRFYTSLDILSPPKYTISCVFRGHLRRKGLRLLRLYWSVSLFVIWRFLMSSPYQVRTSLTCPRCNVALPLNETACYNCGLRLTPATSSLSDTSVKTAVSPRTGKQQVQSLSHYFHVCRYTSLRSLSVITHNTSSASTQPA